MRSIITTTIALASFILCTPALAGGMSWQGTVTAESGFVNPAVLVGFTPQPEPPGHTLCGADRGTTAPSVLLGDIEDGYAELMVAVATSEASVEEIVLAEEACGENKETVLYPLDEGEEVELEGTCAEGSLPLTVRLDDGTELPVAVDVSDSSGIVDPASIVGFTPQPEPPGMPAVIGLAVDFDSRRVSAASASVSVTDPGTGSPITLQ